MSDTANPFQQLQEEALEQTGPEDAALNIAQTAIDSLLKGLDTATSVSDVMIIVIRLSTFGVALGVLAEAIEARLDFIDSQTKDETYKAAVASAKANVTFARRHGRGPEQGDVLPGGGIDPDAIVVKRVREAVAQHCKQFDVAPGMTQGLCAAAESGVRG